MKLVYCLDSLSTLGGVQCVTITKANAFAQNPANRVWIISCFDDSKQSCIPISNRIGLRRINYELSWRFPWNLIQLPIKRVSLIKKLQKTLCQIEPDIVISTGGLDQWLVPFTKGNWSTIREYHVVKDVNERNNDSRLLRITHKLAEHFATFFILKRFDRIVVLTQEERRNHWLSYKNVCVIPNPVRFTQTRISRVENKSILACGRLCYQKNYSSLLRAFRLVVNKFPEWHLDILGEGDERSLLESEISRFSLQNNVSLRGNQEDVQKWMSEASIFVLSSRYEGLPLVLLEAMSCGLPVISYACPSGPKDIISDGIDGFLVSPGDEQMLGACICLLADDNDLRKKMSSAALKKAKQYSLETIITLWMTLFEQLRNDNDRIS